MVLSSRPVNYKFCSCQFHTWLNDYLEYALQKKHALKKKGELYLALNYWVWKNMSISINKG